MATLDSLYDRVWDEMPSVTESYALRALSDSVKEFCTRTHAWREPVGAVSVGAATYALSTPDGTTVTAVKSVNVGDLWLHPVAPFNPCLGVRDSNPRRYNQRVPSEIELDALTTESIAVVAALTLVSGRTDVDIPDDLMDEYAEAIAAGAKMRLARMMNQDWSNPAAAPGYGVVYYTAITTAKRRDISSLDQADLRMEMRAWV